MKPEKESIRVFIGVKVVAPWPENFPTGKVIEEKNRHITVCFIGDVDLQKKEELSSFPAPEFFIGVVGRYTKCIPIPKKHPRLIAWEGDLFDEVHLLEMYQKKVLQWAKEKKYECKNESRPFYAHTTMCRKNFDQKAWQEAFSSIPFYISGIHLYESLGNSDYEILHSHKLIEPFEQIPHTADIAFLIRGENLDALHRNAETALAFLFPPMVQFFEKTRKCNSLEEIIQDLNEHVTKADIEWGCSFKAVSFHGKVKEMQNRLLEWEMIIDV